MIDPLYGPTTLTAVTASHIITTHDSNNSGTYFGDSGGPHFFQNGNLIVIAGVASRIDSTGCSDVVNNYFTNLQLYDLLILIPAVVPDATFY